MQLPTNRAEMEALGWDSCDMILVTGDAYVDLPSFGMAVIGRVLEAQGFRVGIIAQPDWKSADAFRSLGKPNICWGVTSGNMDSMVNRYTSERRIRSDDAYTVGDVGGKRPDRAVTVYAQRCREAFKGVPVIIGGIEASLRRIAHYDYWSDKVRHAVLMDSKADILVYGNGERQIVEIMHRLAAGESIKDMLHIRGTAVMCQGVPDGWIEMDSTEGDTPHTTIEHPNPYLMQQDIPCDDKAAYREREQAPAISILDISEKRAHTVIRLPSYETVANDEVLYAHASRLLHLETNPGNARALIQKHGGRDVWINPPAIPLSTVELDGVFDLPYSRLPYIGYGDIAAKLAKVIAREADREKDYRLMEFCGGHTHAIFRFGIQDLMPENVNFVHGPGCPVCVLPKGRIDNAIELVQKHDVILCTYADLVRVPATKQMSLLKAKADGGDIRMVYSTQDALNIARQNPERQVVFFAIGFETTTPPTAVAIQIAKQEGLNNLQPCAYTACHASYFTTA